MSTDEMIDSMTDQTQDPSLDRTRRRFVRRRRMHRWSRWRAVLALLLVVALLATGVWLVFFSQVLAVKGVEVTGLDDLSERQVLAAAAVPDQEPLARVDLESITRRVRALAPVKAVQVSRKWPDTISIAVTERTPVAVVEIGAGFKAIDTDGVLFDDYAKQPKDLPLLTSPADADQDALTEGAKVVASLPGDLRAKVDHVEVASIDDITLVMRDEKSVMWGSAEQSDDKAEVLDALLKAQPEAREYDVSAPGQATVTK